MGSHIQGIDFDNSYSPLSHDDSLRINIDITYMHKLTAIILNFSNAFQNKNFPFMKASVSVHYPIIWTDLKNITPMFLSIDMVVHFFFNEWM